MSVATRIMDYLPNTLILEGISTVFSILIGVVMGVVAAHKRGGLFDSASVITSLIAFSLPTFWLGLLLIAAFHGILPSGRIVDDNMPAWSFIWLFGTKISFPTMVELQSRIMHLILPVTVLTLIQYGNYLLLTRATMLETLTEDYILTAKAKGLKERTIIFKHALKNASLPIITSSALAFGFLISGAMITETVFSYPGIGFLTINSINVTHDYPVLHAIFYVTALTVIIANFISDLLYGVIDPRIKYG
jgi:ABC-type dipeptide/oligopeptide/nickel transport system permease component